MRSFVQDQETKRSQIRHPDLTVGVLTLPGRLQLYKQLLASLETAASCYPGRIHLLTASPHSTKIRKATSSCELSSQHLVTDGTAPQGRQRILDNAQTDWLLFVDDDCKVAQDIFSTYALSIHQQASSNIGALYGKIEFAGDSSAAFRACEVSGFLSAFTKTHQKQKVEWAPTANSLFHVPAAKDVGGFDTSNPVDVSGEDVDLGIRLKRSGYQSITIPKAVVHHQIATWNDIWSNIQRVYLYGKSEAWLSHKYPNRRQGSIEMPSRSRLVLSIVQQFGSHVLTTLNRMDSGKQSSTESFLISISAILYILANTLGYYIQTLRTSGDLVERLCTRFRFEPLQDTPRHSDTSEQADSAPSGIGDE